MMSLLSMLLSSCMTQIYYPQATPGIPSGVNPATVTKTRANTGSTVDVVWLSVTAGCAALLAVILQNPWILLVIPGVGIPHLGYCLLKRNRII